MDDYEALRAEKIKRNRALLQELRLENAAAAIETRKAKATGERPVKRIKIERPARQPTRISARIAAIEAQPPLELKEEDEDERPTRRREIPRGRHGKLEPFTPQPVAQSRSKRLPSADVDETIAGWSQWEITAPAPTRDSQGVFHFKSHPDFVPNKSPPELLREGVFGGSYFRPFTSVYLDREIKGDWKELPAEWTEGLDVKTHIASPIYDPGMNKYKAACGQSIEQWEANGWIDHRHDVRGWFQWYCRFYQGRRCDDDDRQISRWKKCVGDTGRWRRILLKKYVTAGVRTVEEGKSEDQGISPAIHQTCLHWAWDLSQEAVDDWWDS